jgi:NTE family protein
VAVAHWLARGLPVVAVALSQPAEQFSKQPILSLPLPGPAPLVEIFSGLRVTQAFNIFIRSIEISTQMLTELRLKVDRPDILIRPPVSHIGLLDKADVTELVNLGYQSAQQALPELIKVVSWPGSLQRQVRTWLGAKPAAPGKHDPQHRGAKRDPS